MPPAAPRGYHRDMSPMLVRELRATLRGRRFAAVHLLALALTAFVVLGFALTEQIRWSAQSAYVGSGIFCIFLLCQAALALLVLPAWGSTSIVSERENHSLDLLVTTTMRPWQIVWGKLAASLVYALVFFSSTLPLLCVAFLFGGVSLLELTLAMVGLACEAVMVAACSVCISAWSPSSPWAITLAYGLAFAFAGVTLLPVAGQALHTLLVQRGLPNAEFLQDLAALPPGRLALAVAAGAFAVAAWVAFFFLLATVALTPPAENRSTGLRVFYAAFVVACAALGLAALTEAWPGLDVEERWKAACALWAGVATVAVASTALAIEAPGLSRRLRAGLERLVGWRRLLRPLFPGAGRAAAFVLLANAVLLGAVWLGVSELTLASLPGVPAPAALDLRMASGESLAVAAAFLGFSAGLAVLLGRHVRTAWVRVLVLAGVLTFLAAAPVGVYALDRQQVRGGPPRGPSLRNTYVLSPVLAYLSIWDGRRILADPDPAAQRIARFPYALAADLPGTPVWRAFCMTYGFLAALLFAAAGLGAAFGRKR